MPFLIYPAIGFVAGFGTGYFTGSTTKNIVLTVGAVGVGYLAYQAYQGSK